MYTHLHQSPFWGKYLTTLGWKTQTIDQNLAFIRNIPLLNKKLVKIQRPHHPLKPQHLDALAKEQGALSIIVEPPIHGIEEESLKKSGWHESKTSYAQSATVLIDLIPKEESIFSSFSENARRQIKKSQRNNLITKTIFMGEYSQQEKQPELNESFESFWHLWDNLTSMKHFYKLPKSELKNKMTALAPLSYLSFAYEQANEPIAVVWYCIWDKVIYYLHTGITQKGYDLSANYQLVWEGIKLGKNHDCQKLDFEGLYDPRLPNQTKRWKGFSEFKSRFHGEEIYYPLPLVKHYNPIFKAFFYFGEYLSPA